MGWRVRAGWRLLEILSVTFRSDDKYELVVLMQADPDWGHQLAWPPITVDPPDDVELALGG